MSNIEQVNGNSEPNEEEVCILVKMPAFGDPYSTEKVITDWYVEDGSIVDKDELLFAASTEKADIDVPSPAAGVVEVIVVTDSEVQTDQVIAIIHTTALWPVSQISEPE